MIEPGSATGTLFASADGEAIGGRLGGTPSDLSLFSSSEDGFGLASTGWFLFSARLTDGDGEGVGSAFLSPSFAALPFSSSASLPTSLAVVSETSFSAAKTEAPASRDQCAAIRYPPLETRNATRAKSGEISVGGTVRHDENVVIL